MRGDSTPVPGVSLSPLDEERFGMKSAKAMQMHAGDIPGVMRFCEENGVEFLIARCRTDNLKAAQEMEKQGFLLMDTLLYFSRDLTKRTIPDEDPEYIFRAVRPGEEQEVMAVAAEAFRGYLGHYHADPLLDKVKCDEVYTDWAYRSCVTSQVADYVVVAEGEGRIVGFGTMRRNSPEEGEGLLFGVLPSFRGKGIYRSIITNCLKWSRESGFERMIISTQVTNLASRKVWVRHGFEPDRSYYTFHRWFSPHGGEAGDNQRRMRGAF